MSNRTPEIDIEQLARAEPGQATVLDVRERSEYVTGHVPGAALLSMTQLSFRLDEIEKARPVYVICATGNRSAAMTDLLVAAGFDAYSVAGGTAAWARSGRLLATGIEAGAATH
jgi:rhodanese-related sulfurtransferase